MGRAIPATTDGANMAHRDRTQETAERLAAGAFDAAAPEALEWIKECFYDGGTAYAVDAVQELVFSALAFSRDAGQLTALKRDAEALREIYVDERADRYYAEAQQIERELAEFYAEEQAEAMREARAIEAYEAGTRG